MTWLLRPSVACLALVFAGFAFADEKSATYQLTAGEEASLLTTTERGKLAAIRTRPLTLRAAAITFDPNALTGEVINITTMSGEVLSFKRVKSGVKEVRELRFGLLPIKHRVFGWIGQTANMSEAVFSADDEGLSGRIYAHGYGAMTVGMLSKSHYFLSEFDQAKQIPRGDHVVKTSP